MTGIHYTKAINRHGQYATVLDMRDSYTCSFTEFAPFCPKLYYISNFKDFGTSALAC